MVWHADHRALVALSRAREGLFIFGNAANLSSRSRMWRHIIEELEKDEALGPALPIACHRHPETLEYICKPGQLPQIAPDGVYDRSLNSSSALNYVFRRMYATLRLPSELWSLVSIQGNISPFSIAYEINIPFSVTVMIRNMPLCRACSHAQGFVQGVIHASSNALPHVAIVSSRKPMLNFRADT
jgi:hypothetical protein